MSIGRGGASELTTSWPNGTSGLSTLAAYVAGATQLTLMPYRPTSSEYVLTSEMRPPWPPRRRRGSATTRSRHDVIAVIAPPVPRSIMCG